MPSTVDLTDADGSERLTFVRVEGVPADATFGWNNALPGTVTNLGGGSYEFTGTTAEIQALLASITIDPPADSDDDITLSVDCTANAVSQTGIYVNEDNAPRITVATTVSHNTLFAGLVLDSTLNLNAEQEAAGMGI